MERVRGGRACCVVVRITAAAAVAAPENWIPAQPLLPLCSLSLRISDHDMGYPHFWNAQSDFP
jgi:hypothetical protein